MTAKKLMLPLCICLMLCTTLMSQDTSKVDRLINLPDKFFQALDKKNSSIEHKLNRQADKYLAKLQGRENKLKRKLWEKDSTLALQLFNGIDERYNELRKAGSNPPRFLNAYSGHLDSLSTALHFLKDQSSIVPGGALEKTLTQYKGIQDRFNQTNQIKAYVSQRQQLLKQHFEKLGMVKELKKYQKNVYYYQQQVKEYKDLFNNPRNAETKLLQLVLKQSKFKDFFAKNSFLGSVFGLPSANSPPSVSMQGLQTRAMVNQTLAASFGNTFNVNSQLQQNAQAAAPNSGGVNNPLRVSRSGSYGNSNSEDIPGFKPNSQKTKSFFQRLEYGMNIQSQKAKYLFPVTSDIGFSLGYKINDRSSVGIGASYKLGLGSGWNKIRISHQGIGLRSYLDWKIKGSFYLSGGYEQNYRNVIHSIAQLQNYSAWQASGLIGVSKKYSVSKKMKGDVKLLWDFMSYQQIPRSQPILFRVGYNFK